MNTNILGDKKHRRYNEGLFDVVNRKAELGELEVGLPKTEIAAPEDTLDLGEILVDVENARNGDVRNHDDWSAYWRTKDKQFMSSADLYKIVKRLFDAENTEGKKKVLESLRADLKRGITTGSFLTYSPDLIPNCSHFTIYHRTPDLMLRSPAKVCDWEGYNELFKESPGVRLCQQLFGTNDTIEDLFTVLLNFAEVSLDKIFVKTELQDLLTGGAKAVFLYKSDDKLRIDCSYSTNSATGAIGRSRGVIKC